MPEKVVAVVFARNEERHIGKTLEILNKFRRRTGFKRVLDSFRGPVLDKVIVVNDFSSDKTEEIARKAGAIVVNHETNQGKRGCFITGAFAARKIGASAMLVLDADIEDFPRKTFQRMVREVTTGGKHMAIARQFEAQDPVIRVFTGEMRGPSKIVEKFFNGQRAFNMNALTPLFKGNKMWLDALQSTKHTSQLVDKENKGRLWGLEFALDKLIPANKQIMLEEPIYTAPAYRTFRRTHQIIGNAIVRKVFSDRKRRATQLRSLRAKRKL